MGSALLARQPRRGTRSTVRRNPCMCRHTSFLDQYPGPELEAPQCHGSREPASVPSVPVNPAPLTDHQFPRQGNLPSASCQQSSDSASDAAFCQLSAMLRQEVRRVQGAATRPTLTRPAALSQTRAWPVSIVAEAVAMGRVRAVAEARRARQVVRVALPLAAHDAHAVLSGHRPLTAVRESAPRDAAVRRGDWVLATAERHLRASTRLPLLARPAERVLAGSALIEPWVKRMRVPVSELAGELGLVVESEETNLMLLRRTREWASARIKEQSCMLLHAGAQRGAAALRDDWVRVVPLWHSDDASPPEAALPPGDEAGPRDRGGGGANSAPESFGGTAEDEPGQLCVDEEGHLVRLSPQELLRRIERGDSSLSAGLLMRQLVAAESLEDLTLLQGGPEGESRGGSRSQSTDGGALARIRAEAESRERGNGPLLRGVPALRVPAGGLPTTALPAAPAPRTVQRAWRFCAAVHVRSSLVRALRALSVADFALAEIAATGLALGSCIDAEVASVARAAGLATWPRPDPSLGSSGLRVATPKAADVEEAGSGAPRLLDPAGIECVGVGALHTLMTVVRALETAAARLADGEVEAARARMARGDTSLQSLGFAQPEEVSSDHMAAAVAVAAAAAAALEGRAWLLATLARASGACADASAFTAVVSWAADVGQLPTLNLHSVRALTDSALHAASLHYATTALDRVMRTAEREADAVFSNLPGTRALLLDAAAVQSCRDAAEAPAPAVGLAPRVGLRLGQMLRAVSARRMATALAHEGGAAAQQLPLLDSVQPSLVSLAGGGSQAQVTAVPGTLVATVAAQAGADPAGTAPAPEVFSRACRAALHYAQFAAACITAHEVEAAANGVLAARRGLQSEQHVASPSSRPEGDATIPRAASKQGEATPAVGLAPKLAALTSGEGRALALATRSLLRLADGVAAVGALLAGSGHSVPEVLDATRPLRLVVEKGVTDVKAAVEGIAVDAKGKRKDVRGGGDAAPSLGAVAAGLDASAAQWSGLQRQMVAVAAARRTVGDMGLHGLTLKGHDAPAGGDEPGRGIARRGAADVAPSAHSGSVDGSAQDGAGTGDILAQHVGVDGPIDTALILWDPTRPPAGVDSSCVLTETSVDVGRVELLRSIPRLAGVCTEHTGTSADQARLWAALSPLLHVSALVDAAKAQGGTDMAASTVETALTACATVHGALRGGYRFTEWMDMGAKIGRSLWHIAASQAFRTAVQLGSHAAVAVCVEAARMAVGRHGGDITHASTLLFSRAPSACKRTFLGTLSGVKSMLVTFLSADVSRMRGWKEATAAVEQAERVLFLLCRRHRAIRAAAELHTLTASLKASPAAAVGAAGEDATPCLAPHVCPYAWTALQAGTDRFAALMTERARAHSVPLPAQFAGGGESGPFLAYQALTAAGTDLQHCVEGLVEDLLLRIAAARSDADAALLAVTTAPTSDALSGQAVRAAEDVLEEAMSGLDRVATPVDAKSGQVMLLRRVRCACRGSGIQSPVVFPRSHASDWFRSWTLWSVARCGATRRRCSKHTPSSKRPGAYRWRTSCSKPRECRRCDGLASLRWECRLCVRPGG